MYAIFSDVHANLEALDAVLDEATRLGVERYVCLGDTVGYGASPAECIERIVSLGPDVIVQGNHDTEAALDGEPAVFNAKATEAILWTREQLCAEHKMWLSRLPMTGRFAGSAEAVHASLENPSAWTYILDADAAEACMAAQTAQLCCVGHVHVPAVYCGAKPGQELKSSHVRLHPGVKYVVNVGSVGQPRDGDPRASFVTYCSDESLVEFHRVVYDVETCQRRILRSGLPESLASRLEHGR